MRTLRFVPFVIFIVGAFLATYFLSSDALQARNVTFYSDTISTSKPEVAANHTLRFTLGADIPAGGYFDFVPPSDFTTEATSTFSDRNVELYVNGTPRPAAASVSPGIDGVVINSGTPGSIRYTLNPTTGITAGDSIEFRIGNHTSGSVGEQVIIVGTSSTTTIPGDSSGIYNSVSTGFKQFSMTAIGGANQVSAKFVIFILDPVTAGPADTTELIPPFRYDGTPSTTIAGTSLSVEMSLRTDEFADCKYSTSPGVDFNSMTSTFNSSGLIIHTAVVSITPNNLYQYYVRCIDDEGNYNIDDYLIAFSVNDTPVGDPNAEGNVEGDGTGSGNDGTGSGEGGGGTTGGTEGENDTSGSNTGGGGTGGGGGGGGGNTTGSTPGGGFENTGPYESGDGKVIISGTAFPNSTVTILVDGQIADSVKANSAGAFSGTLNEIARGAYTFGIYATDKNNVKSSTFSTSFTVAGARASSLSNITIAPSIKVTPDPVNPGTTVTFSGYTQPSAVVTLENQNSKSSASLKTLSATADTAGFWSTTLDTTGFSQGTYQVRAKSAVEGGVSSNFSQWTLYGVGQAAEKKINADLNRDGKVNLTDFSILLFWWGTAGGASNPPADINQDGKVSLTDFSILLFNWTG